MISFIIDGREPKSVFDAFGQSVVYERANLDVGDFQISHDGVAVIIAERKTWSDLVSSLSNGRMRDQTARSVDKCRDSGARPVLIIESENVYDWSGKSGSMHNKFMDCCLTKYAMEGFSVLRTRNTVHTKDTLSWLLERCKSGKLPTFEPSLSFQASAAGEKKYRRKDYSKPWEAMLTAIPGISKNKAKSISAKYGSLRALLDGVETRKSINVEGIGKKMEMKIRDTLLGTATL